MEYFKEAIDQVIEISDNLQNDIAGCVQLQKSMMESKSPQEYGLRVSALLEAQNVALARTAEAVLALALAISLSDKESVQRTIDVGKATLASLKARQ